MNSLKEDRKDFLYSSIVYYNGKRYLTEDEGRGWLLVSDGNKKLFCSKRDLDPCREPYRFLPETFYLSGGIFSSSKAVVEKKVKRFFTELAKRPCPPPMIMVLRVISNSDMKLANLVDLLNKFGVYGFGGEIHSQFKWFFPSKDLTKEEKVVIDVAMKVEKSMSDDIKDMPELAAWSLLPKEERRWTKWKTYCLIGRLEELF